ncbi:unnamed protein product, partial [Polarella glacialis]
ADGEVQQARCFCVVVRQRNYFMVCDDEAQKRAWMREISKALGTTRFMTLPHIAMAQQSSPATSDLHHSLLPCTVAQACTVSSNKISLLAVIVNNKNNCKTSNKQQKRKLIEEKTYWNQP